MSPYLVAIIAYVAGLVTAFSITYDDNKGRNCSDCYGCMRRRRKD